MNYKVLKGRKTFFKFLSVMLAIALSFAAVPVNNTVKAASGESQTSLGAPSYDSSLGDVNISTSNGFSMTAVPNEGCYFRGWFKNGIEVSREATFNDATVDTAHLYKAEFYDVNLISDSGFECYENGTNLKEIS